MSFSVPFLLLLIMVLMKISNQYSWEEFHSKEDLKVDAHEWNSEFDYYRLSNMYCDPRQMHGSECSELKQLDWVIGIDASWYDKDLEDGRQVYFKMKRMATKMLEKLKTAVRFKFPLNRFGIYLAVKGGWSEVRKPVLMHCLMVEEVDPWDQMFHNMPHAEDLGMESGERAAGIVQLFKAIDQDYRDRYCKPNIGRFEVQRFVIIFYQSASMSSIQDYMPVIERINTWSRESSWTKFYPNVIFVRFSSSRVDDVFTNSQRSGFKNFGNMFINTFQNSTDADEQFLAEFLVNCACYRHSECVFKIKNSTKCHFENGYGGMEICFRNITKEIVTTPDWPPLHKRLSCYADVMEDCTLEDCLRDCDEKSWEDWSECIEDEPGSGNYSRKRSRFFKKAGYSQFTEHCLENETWPCERTTVTTPTTTETTKTSVTNATTTDDEYIDVTDDPNLRPSIPTADGPDHVDPHPYLHFAFGVFLIFFIVATILGACIFAFVAYRHLARRRRQHERSLSKSAERYDWSKSDKWSNRKSSRSKDRKSIFPDRRKWSRSHKSQKSRDDKSSKSRKSLKSTKDQKSGPRKSSRSRSEKDKKSAKKSIITDLGQKSASGVLASLMASTGRSKHSLSHDSV